MVCFKVWGLLAMCVFDKCDFILVRSTDVDRFQVHLTPHSHSTRLNANCMLSQPRSLFCASASGPLRREWKSVHYFFGVCSLILLCILLFYYLVNS
jgi:hypothetical protein